MDVKITFETCKEIELSGSEIKELINVLYDKINNPGVIIKNVEYEDLKPISFGTGSPVMDCSGTR